MERLKMLQILISCNIIPHATNTIIYFLLQFYTNYLLAFLLLSYNRLFFHSQHQTESISVMFAVPKNSNLAQSARPGPH